jgi:RNA polymerase sigma-70 factor (ECF subfamily)
MKTIAASPAIPGSGALPDAEVVRRVLAGETELFEILMRRHNQRVYRAIRGILRDDAEAEDAMQQAYLLAYSHLADFAGESAVATWLTRIAVNAALARLRRRGAEPRLGEVQDASEEVMVAPADSPEDRAAARESVRRFEAAVERLHPAYRTVLLLREVEELSTAETAASLGISPEAVKVRLHRARLALRQALGEGAEAAPEAFAFLAPRCDRVVAAVLVAIGRPGAA